VANSVSGHSPSPAGVKAIEPRSGRFGQLLSRIAVAPLLGTRNYDSPRRGKSVILLLGTEVSYVRRFRSGGSIGSRPPTRESIWSQLGRIHNSRELVFCPETIRHSQPNYFGSCGLGVGYRGLAEIAGLRDMLDTCADGASKSLADSGLEVLTRNRPSVSGRNWPKTRGRSFGANSKPFFLNRTVSAFQFEQS
jgi:hypothetical protein